MRFRALDGFRGLCALLVALYHFPVHNHILAPRFFLPHAQMLMDFFFVLVFIIALSFRLFEKVSGLNLDTLGFAGLDQMNFVYGPNKWVMDGVMLAYLAIVIAVAGQTFKYIEEPGRKVFSVRRAKVPALAAQAA